MILIILRFILFPFSILYGLVIEIRNGLFDLGILRSVKFPVPVISVGNITAGGTGKTPFTLCLLYTSPSPRDRTRTRLPSSA